MARNKRPRKKQVTSYPKSIRIIDEDGEFRMFKVWGGKKVSKEPFIITDNLEDLVEAYEEGCTKWQIKPDIKYIRALINKYQQSKKEATNEQANFLKGHFG